MVGSGVSGRAKCVHDSQGVEVLRWGAPLVVLPDDLEEGHRADQQVRPELLPAGPASESSGHRPSPNDTRDWVVPGIVSRNVARNLSHKHPDKTTTTK